MELLDTRQLRAFAMLAETGSFTAAAERLYLTQSAVSHSIKALETQLQCALVERLGKKISLTPSGETLLAHARSILRSIDLAQRDVAAVCRPGYGRIRVGAAQTVCQYILPAVVREFRECFPQCEVSIQSGDTDELLDLLENGQVDVSLGLRVSKYDQFSYRPLFQDHMAYVHSPQHPWATRGKLLLEDLAREQFIVYSRRSLTTRMVGEHFQRSGLRLPLMIELGNMEAIKEFARIGVGVGIIAPWIARKELTEASLLMKPLSNGQIAREWGFYSLRNRALTMAEETLAGLCQAVCHNLQEWEGGKATR